jgi:hypothetical protein
MNVRSVDLTEGGVLIHFSNGTSVSLLPSSSALTGAMTAIGFCPRRASRFASLGQLFGVVQKHLKVFPRPQPAAVRVYFLVRASGPVSDSRERGRFHREK